MRPSARALLREPLLHFLAIGALIFGLDQAVRSDRASPRVIVVDHKVQGELTKLFEDGQGRKPTPDEMKVLIDRWIYNEVMYREAVALGLDKGDEMFRSRLELKLRMMLIDNVVLDPPSDDELKKWLQDNRDRFTAPRRFDFVQIFLEGDDGEGRATELASRLVDGAIPAPYNESTRFYKNRTRDNIAMVFGDQFAAGLVDSGSNGWHALRSPDGWHVAQLLDDKPAVEPDFESMKPQLEADWRKATQKRLAGEAFRDIRARYNIRVEDAR